MTDGELVREYERLALVPPCERAEREATDVVADAPDSATDDAIGAKNP